jgi:hypothetical protein
MKTFGVVREENKKSTINKMPKIDTLVPTMILNSEISWFCFDFPKWGPVSFIITNFNVFVQFFE